MGMFFNPGPIKQAVKIKFSTKRNPVDQPSVEFNSIPVVNVNKHKLLGTILDSKMSSASHIQAAL